MKRVLALVLAGGSARDLSVLAEMRSATALPFGGKYRVIDFTLSNLCNSEIYEVGVLTQHAPLSLNAHIGIGKPWDLDRRDGGVQILQPYQRQSASATWYQGTADAVRQNLDVVENSRAKWALILPGDLVYKMDYSWLLGFHQEEGARLTLAVGPIDQAESHRFGIVRIDESGRVVEFHEKPAEPTPGPGFLGVACMDVDFLRAELLEHPEANNIVTEIIQPIVARGDRVDAYRHDAYWEDVGNVDAYYRASMDLLENAPRLNLYDPDWIIYTRSVELPPARLGLSASIERSLLANGCCVDGKVEHSILFPGVQVQEGAEVRDSILMNGANVCSGASLDRVIVDKDARIGRGALVGYGDNVPYEEGHDILKNGLTILGRDADIPEGARIGRHCVVEPGAGPDDFSGLPVESGRIVRRGRALA